ncbi:MAG: ribonuclease H family protein [Anaeroplasma sp.]|uniref:ribonuclease H family protein n=1 Tax=Anaeroplasma sp. TaxID=1872523 RepID=UPI002A90D627|nr:ribonuclease H family protein [Anaeroplasma sp.]MDY5982491.1 ribonuclease H family protein [Anaeroplasma sp.]
MKYYAIKDDLNHEIVDSWDLCKEHLKNYTKPKYKSFKTKEEAEAFLNGEILDDNITAPKAYIDGSFDSKTNAYSFGGVLIIDGKEYPYKKKFEPDEYSSLRNVAGEIQGAGFIIAYAVKKGIKELHIFYDYLGIEKWFTHEWKANSKIAIDYQILADRVKDKIKVYFHKVKSHTNNHYNDYADKLAKEALGL